MCGLWMNKQSERGHSWEKKNYYHKSWENMPQKKHGEMFSSPALSRSNYINYHNSKEALTDNMTISQPLKGK